MRHTYEGSKAFLKSRKPGLFVNFGQFSCFRTQIRLSQYRAGYISKTAKYMRIQVDPDPEHCPIGKVPFLQALHTNQSLNNSISRFLCFHTTGAVFNKNTLYILRQSVLVFIVCILNHYFFAFVQTYRYLTENSETVFICPVWFSV
jgi:hypothetical protein